RLYLNFSDPWPKKRHWGRRLTHKDKLTIYREILSSSGQLHFKTDNEALFDYSLEQLWQEGWSLGRVCRDLWGAGGSGAAGNGVALGAGGGWGGFEPEPWLTEYERRFVGLGQPIYRCEAWNRREA
ncbi:MAG: hypothetical protein LBK98_02640, partial [Peptococcaceae bacterium]|nr:hypothetical protein [Peptococcaceae bacterium]